MADRTKENNSHLEGHTPMTDTEFSKFVGSVSAQLEAQGKTLEKLDETISTVKEDVSSVKTDLKLMRQETDIKRKGCDGQFDSILDRIADVDRRLSTKTREYDERFSRDFNRLNALEAKNKTELAIEKAESTKIVQKRATVEYVVMLAMFIITAGSLIVAIVK